MTAGVAAVLSRGGDLHEAVRELIGRVRMTAPAGN